MAVPILSFFAAVGALISALGVWIYWKERRFPGTAIPVKVEIIELVEDRDPEGDTFSPVFRIIEGDFAGRTQKSSYASGIPIHSLGECANGHFDPATGRIESIKSNRAGKNFGVLLIVFGLIFTGLSLFAPDEEAPKSSATLTK